MQFIYSRPVCGMKTQLAIHAYQHIILRFQQMKEDASTIDAGKKELNNTKQMITQGITSLWSKVPKEDTDMEKRATYKTLLFQKFDQDNQRLEENELEKQEAKVPSINFKG